MKKTKTDLNNIFRTGSMTYSTSSIFFPENTRKDVTIVYAFVRTLDNFVDKIPPDFKKFNEFKKDYYNARTGFTTLNTIVNLFHTIEKKYKFDTRWTDDFIKSMEMDFTKKTYSTIKDLEQYMYGSANIIGLYMAKLLGLPSASYHYAELLGKSMQYLNFIRDIDEDLYLGRIYFPQSDLKKFGLRTLKFEETKNKKKEFIAFMKDQIARYLSWQVEAEKGFPFIPKRFLIPIKTASDMYKWTADVISKDPFIIYRKKVKPSALRILLTGTKNAFQTINLQTN